MKSPIFQNPTEKNLIDFCPETLLRLGMLCAHLSRVALRIIKTKHTFLLYKIFQGRKIYQIFSVVFWKIDDFMNTFRHYLTFIWKVCLFYQRNCPKGTHSAIKGWELHYRICYYHHMYLMFLPKYSTFFIKLFALSSN